MFPQKDNLSFYVPVPICILHKFSLVGYNRGWDMSTLALEHLRFFQEVTNITQELSAGTAAPETLLE